MLTLYGMKSKILVNLILENVVYFSKARNAFQCSLVDHFLKS